MTFRSMKYWQTIFRGAKGLDIAEFGPHGYGLSERELRQRADAQTLALG